MYRKVRRTRGIGWNLLMLSICWNMPSDYLTNWSMIRITSLNISLPPGTWILPLYGLYTPLCCLRKSASLANWWSGILKWCPLMIISNHRGIKSFNSSKNMKINWNCSCTIFAQHQGQTLRTCWSTVSMRSHTYVPHEWQTVLLLRTLTFKLTALMYHLRPLRATSLSSAIYCTRGNHWCDLKLKRGKCEIKHWEHECMMNTLIKNTSLHD